MRRFAVGDEFVVGGLRFRITSGLKAEDDLVMWWLTPDGWRRVPMAVVAMMTEFFVENEGVLKAHRPHWRHDPADFFIGFLRHAIARGWVDADAQLQRDRDG